MNHWLGLEVTQTPNMRLSSHLCGLGREVWSAKTHFYSLIYPQETPEV